jgi:hypothetical protein
MSRRHVLPLLWLTSGLACTPLGLWIYDDPAVTLSRVRLNVRDSIAHPVSIALDLRNPNDYELTTTRVEFRLQLDDLPTGTGQLTRGNILPLPKLGTATVALPLKLRREITACYLLGLRLGTHRFLMEGQATFTTPFGLRKVRFAHEGELVFGETASPATARAGPDASGSE